LVWVFNLIYLIEATGGEAKIQVVTYNHIQKDQTLESVFDSTSITLYWKIELTHPSIIIRANSPFDNCVNQTWNFPFRREESYEWRIIYIVSNASLNPSYSKASPHHSTLTYLSIVYQLIRYHQGNNLHHL